MQIIIEAFWLFVVRLSIVLFANIQSALRLIVIWNTFYWSDYERIQYEHMVFPIAYGCCSWNCNKQNQFLGHVIQKSRPIRERHVQTKARDLTNTDVQSLARLDKTWLKWQTSKLRISCNVTFNMLDVLWIEPKVNITDANILQIEQNIRMKMQSSKFCNSSTFCLA